MKKTISARLLQLSPLLLLSMPVWSDTIELDSSYTISDTITAEISGCRGYETTVADDDVTVTVDGTDIEVSVVFPSIGFVEPVCYEGEVEIGTLSAGEYTVSYVANEGGWPREVGEATFSVTDPNNTGTGTDTDTDTETDTSNAATVDADLNLHIPLVIYQAPLGDINLTVDFEYAGTDEDGNHLWKLTDYGVVD